MLSSKSKMICAVSDDRSLENVGFFASDSILTLSELDTVVLSRVEASNEQTSNCLSL